MKVSPDRHNKAGMLSLALQRFEASPKFKKPVPAEQEEQSIPSEEITVPGIRFEPRRQVYSREKARLRSKGRDNSQQKGKEHKDEEVGTGEDEEELLAMCSGLASKVADLRQEKHDFVVSLFEEEERASMNQRLQVEGKVIKERYGAQRRQLVNAYQQEKAKLQKGIEEVGKFKAVYGTMLEEMETKRKALTQSYERAVGKVNESRQKLVHEWKRSCNQEIIKIGLKQ